MRHLRPSFYGLRRSLLRVETAVLLKIPSGFDPLLSHQDDPGLQIECSQKHEIHNSKVF